MTPQANQAINAIAGTMMIGSLLGFSLFILWIYNLLDVIRSEFKNPSNKTMWILLLLFLAPFAAIIYPIMVKGQKVEKDYQIKNQDTKKSENKNDWF